MKILNIIPYFTPKRGGDVNVVYNLSNQLAKRGYEVTIITTDFEFDEEYAKSIEGVNVIPFKCIANYALFLYSPSMKKWLRNNIKDFNVVHLHTFRAYQNNLIKKYAKMHGVPYIVQAHGSVLPFHSKIWLKKTYDFVWGSRILKNASKVVALTKTEAEQYKRMGVKEDKIEIVPNGINLDEYENPPKKGEFRKKYSIRDDEKTIMYLGRIHKIKGLDLLIDVFFDIVTELENVKLLIVGPDDGYLASIKNRISRLHIEEKIIFTGPLYGIDKLGTYIDADVYVLPSIYETFPMSVLEAWACGTPVIVTDRCGIADFVDGKVGYVVEYDKNQLRDAIFKVLNNEGLRKRFEEEGKRLVREEFSWDKVVRQVEEVYKSVYSKGGLL